MSMKIRIDFLRLAAAVGIAFGVSVLSKTAPACAGILQGTIAAAAVINEIIAVLLAKKGFEWAGELYQAKEGKTA